MNKDFSAFLEVWNTLNYNRTKEQQDFCLAFKRQIIPTMTRLIATDKHKDLLKKILEIPYEEQVKMVWNELYAQK